MSIQPPLPENEDLGGMHHEAGRCSAAMQSTQIFCKCRTKGPHPLPSAQFLPHSVFSFMPGLLGKGPFFVQLCPLLLGKPCRCLHTNSPQSPCRSKCTNARKPHYDLCCSNALQTSWQGAKAVIAEIFLGRPMLQGKSPEQSHSSSFLNTSFPILQGYNIHKSTVGLMEFRLSLSCLQIWCHSSPLDTLS